MKRILSFILCGVLCLGLCACGSSGNKHGEYDRLLDMLDQHDYQGAVNYINNLAYDYAQQNKDDSAQQYVYTAALTGEWIAYATDKGVQVPKVVFHDDGTCTIGENNYLWQVMDEGKTHLSVNILNGAEQVHSFSLSKNDSNGNITGNSSNIVKDKHINFYNPAHYEVMEITVDNWDDYFTVLDYFSYETNEFDEVTRICANSQWKLADTYYSRLWQSQSDVAVEYTCNRGDRYAQWDLATKTCTLTDTMDINLDNGAARVYTYTEKMSNYGDSSTEADNDYYFGYRFMSASGWENSDGETYFDEYMVNLKLSRAQGSLWLVKENIKNLQKTEE